MLTIHVDADACPVKDEVYRVARRYQMPVKVVANAPLRVPADALVELVDSKQVEPQEAYLKATDKVGILNMLKQRGKDVSFADADDARAAGATAEAPAKAAGRR